MDTSANVTSTLKTRDYHCKVCDLYLDTADSLEVHLQYHKENLYVKWGTANQQNDDNTNEVKVKTESTVTAPADSSDSMINKSNSDYQQRGTPETSSQYHHPGTPQSYHSAPSPYQTTDHASYSPGISFGNNYSHSSFVQNNQTQQVNWDQSQQNQDYQKSTRFHPYNMQERGSQVSSSSSLYGQSLNQPTPSPSPKQCDKCSFVCDSVMQLNEHCNSAHAGESPALASTLMSFHHLPGKQFSNSNYSHDIVQVKKENEETSSSDILDLDSQKFVYQEGESNQHSISYEDTQQSNGELNTKSMPVMQWETQKLYNNLQINGNGSISKDQFGNQKSPIHPDQNVVLPNSQEQKSFFQNGYSSMAPSNDCYGLSSSKPDLKPPFRPYDSPAAPQITSTQPANSISSTLPSVEGKGANWKSNEARRPKTYNCTACNKWFTSSGHLKRHYNTTLHKNAVKSSGQPDPAAMPISCHHHPTGEAARAQHQAPDANLQSSAPAEDNNVLRPPFVTQNFDGSHQLAPMQPKSPYTHHQQVNLNNNFGNNNSPTPPQQQGTPQILNISSQPPIATNSNGSDQGQSNVENFTQNPPNGEAGPSVLQNHHMRGLLSVPTSNISTPPLVHNTQAHTTHTLPPFSHLGVNQSYNPGSAAPIMASVPDLTPTPLYLGQNFQETIAHSYPNGMSPHVMDLATSNLPLASPATFGESAPEEVHFIEQDSLNDLAGGRLPSFAQLQPQGFNVYVSSYVIQPYVGGQVNADDSSAEYMISEPEHSPVQYNNVDIGDQSMDYGYSYSPRETVDSVDGYSPESVKVYPYGYVVGGTTVNQGPEVERSNNSQVQIFKIENIMDYANKENYTAQIRSPSSPESAKVENDSCSSPAVTSTVSTPLIDRNQPKKMAGAVVHKCYECDKIFNKACYLTQHNKTFHSGAKPFKCDRCGKRFADGVSCKDHYQKHTYDNKPFKCNECPKSFNHKTDLRRHMCLHTGSKPFACDHCGKGFIRKDHMVKHYEIHLKKSGSRLKLTKAE